MKVGTDGVLLGAWAELPPAFDVDRVRPLLLDVGAGTGLISLMLAQRFPSAEISAVEIDGESACECSDNFARSPWHGRMSVVNSDFLTAEFCGGFNLIVSNPPFFANGAKAPDEARHAARHEDALPLAALIERGARLLEPDCGALALVLPSERADEAEFAAELSHLHLWRKTILTTVPGKAPRRVLLQFLNRAGGVDECDDCASENPIISNECLSTSSGSRTSWHRELVKDFYLNP
ncbi:MAG: methyltransferase [Muribaculaceae bacterium]|nr:methyltransferase [Muribaculaceae bacterium]